VLPEHRVQISYMFLRSKVSWQNEARYARVMAFCLGKLPGLTHGGNKNHDKGKRYMRLVIFIVV